MFVALVKDPGAGWGLPDGSPPPEPARRQWSVPWRALIWITACVLLCAASRTVGGWTGYVLLLVAVAAGSFGLERGLGSRPAGGMRDYQA